MGFNFVCFLFRRWEFTCRTRTPRGWRRRRRSVCGRTRSRARMWSAARRRTVSAPTGWHSTRTCPDGTGTLSAATWAAASWCTRPAWSTWAERARTGATSASAASTTRSRWSGRWAGKSPHVRASVSARPVRSSQSSRSRCGNARPRDGRVISAFRRLFRGKPSWNIPSFLHSLIQRYIPISFLRNHVQFHPLASISVLISTFQKSFNQFTL